MSTTGNKLILRPVSSDKINELIDFSQRSPWETVYSMAMVERFLTELVSSPDLIFDLYDYKGRIATAVLIDKVKNPNNDACLELIGIRTPEVAREVLSELLDIALQKVPPEKDGFQVGVLDDGSSLDDFFIDRNMVKHYSIYEMENEELSLFPNSSSETSEDRLGDEAEIALAKSTDASAIYRTLVQAFLHNKEASIPDETTWTLRFLKSFDPAANNSYEGRVQSEKPRTFVVRKAGSLVGFANLIEPICFPFDPQASTEIRTIGVLPNFRGQSIGKNLLQRCLIESQKLGFKKCQLSVAVENEKALGLYLSNGFKVVKKYTCYRRSR